MTISYIPYRIFYAKLNGNKIQYLSIIICKTNRMHIDFLFIQFYLNKIKVYSFSYQMQIMLLLKIMHKCNPPFIPIV